MDRKEFLASLVQNKITQHTNVGGSSVGEDSIGRDPECIRNLQDFSTLQGMQELTLQHSAMAMFGISNPYFRVHSQQATEEATIDGKVYTNFSSYDYLGLNGHPRIEQKVIETMHRFGVSASASRLVSGERSCHYDLESQLAQHYETDSAIAMVSGYGTNVSTISALMGQDDIIFYDALCHNSILTGINLSNAYKRSFHHNDMDHLCAILKRFRSNYRRALIVTESVFSMDGDFPDLNRLIELKHAYGCWLMVDEAHGLGVLGEHGRGIAEHFHTAFHEVDIWMGTLSKTLSASGGYICGSKQLVDYLRYYAGGFVYSVGLSPLLAAAASEALTLMHEEPWRVKRLQDNSRYFLDKARSYGLNVGDSQGYAVVPLIVSDSLKAVMLSHKLFEKGINVQPIIYPAVPELKARLRFFITSRHTVEQIDRTLLIAFEAMQQIHEEHAALKSGIDVLISAQHS